MRRLTAFFLLLLTCAAVFADAPAGYYNTASGLSGPALKGALHDIITAGHTVILYDGLFGPERILWQDPANSSNMLLFYNSASVSKNSVSWNREHLWPRSRGVSTDGGPDDSDLFHVVPCDADVNTTRGNLYFDVSSAADGAIINPAQAEAPLCTRDNNSWEPQPSQRGEVARALFYMATRYDGLESGTTDLELVNANPGASQMANLSTLLAWHLADAPDAAERGRNDLIFANYQHNRNPFIDHPEWVAEIWGNGGPGLTALAQAVDTTASEVPMTTGVYLVQLSAAAPAGGVTVAFVMSGAAVGADYALSGAGVSFNAGTGSGTVVIPAGASSAAITLAPVNDGVAENGESAKLTVAAGVGYAAIGGAATVIVTDVPPPPPGGSIATWNFDNALVDPVTATTGAGSVRLNHWTGTISSFAGNSGQSLGLVGVAGNNSWIDIQLPTTGYAGLVVRFWTQGTSTGFNSGTWSWSADGVTFEAVPGVNTAIRTSPFEEKTVDLRSFPALNNQPAVTLRYTLSGATGASGNNRFDDLAINATALPRVSIVASDTSASEHGADVATFTFTSDTAAGAGGLTVAFALSGTASNADDYTVSGAASPGVIVIPSGATSATLTITPLADARWTEFDETVSVQIPASAGAAYSPGAAASATATIHDDTPYSAGWAASYPTFDSAPSADADADGLKNFAECFFNRNPLVPDATPATALARENLPDPNDGNLVKPFATLTCTRRTDTAIASQPQFSTDLATWAATPVLVSAVPGAAPLTQVMKWRAPVPLSGIGSVAPQFLRLQVTAP